MKKSTILLIAIITLAVLNPELLIEKLIAKIQLPVNSLTEQPLLAVPTIREERYREVPDYAFHVSPLYIMPSFYDYFPGSYRSIPIRIQPAQAGMFPGGGVYIVFQATSFAGGTRRVYYVYIEDGSIECGPSLINISGTSAEGFPGIDIDQVTGNPFVSWHGANPANPAFFYCTLTFDQYDLIGVPDLWNTHYGVINNPYTIGGQADQEFIWPYVFIGPSQNPGQRRVYITGDNFTSNIHGNPCENSLIAYADFNQPTDLDMYNPNQWTYNTVPQLDNWRNLNVRPFKGMTVSRETGNIGIMGHTTDLDGDIPYHPNDVLFLLENSNYGAGAWDLHTADPTIPVDNPNDYFIGDGNMPFQDMRYSLMYNRNNTVVDDEGNYHFVGLYTLRTEESTWFPNMSTIKHIKFISDTEEFVVTDLYPRNDDGSFYLPWFFPPGEDDPIINYSYPVYFWNTDDIFHENYTRIISSGSRMVALFQDSTKARLYHVFGFDEYAPWANVPETYIMVSNDYGETWSDPIILNSIETPELVGLIPTYWYLGDKMEHLNGDWYRIHLFFYSQNNYGSYIQGNGPNTGGTLRYTSIDIEFPSMSPYPAPRNLIAIGGDEMVELNWTIPYNANPLGYNVYRDDLLINSTLITETNYIDTDVENFITYSYYVTAVYDVQESDPSNAQEVTPLARPTNLSAFAGDEAVELIWDEVVSDYLNGYNLYRDAQQINQDLIIETEFIDYDVINGITYTYTVTALYDEFGESIYSDPIEATPLAAPVDLEASIGDGMVTLTWQAPDQTNLLGYNVYRDGEPINIELLIDPEYVDEDVIDFVVYSYWVTAYYEFFGESTPCEPVEVILLAVPGELTAVIVDNKNVLLEWTTPEIPDITKSRSIREKRIDEYLTIANQSRNFFDYELTGYRIYRDDELIAENDHLTLSYLDEELATGTYIYYVTALYDLLESIPGNPVEIEIDLSTEHQELLPQVTELKSNYPNPFNPDTTIEFSLAEAGSIRLNVYNIRGQKITTLFDTFASAGRYKVIWDGKDQIGREMTSGLYLYQLVTDKETFIRKMMLLK